MGGTDGSVVRQPVRIGGGDIQIGFVAAAFLVGQDGQDVVGVHPAAEGVPVVVLHQAVHPLQRFHEHFFRFEHPVSEPDFLQQVGQVVGAVHLQCIAVFTFYGEGLRAGIVNGDGVAAVGVFLGEQGG